MNQARFAKTAKERNKKLVNRIRGKKIGDVDVAREEADSDEAYLEKLKTREARENEKQLQRVIDRIKLKHNDPEGEGQKIKVLMCSNAKAQVILAREI